MIGVLSILGRVPVWVWALAVLAAWGGWHRYQAVSTKADFQQAIVVAEAARAASAVQAATETARRERAHKELLNDAWKKAEAEAAARTRALAAGDKLRAQLAALDARRCAGDSAAAPGGAAASAAGDLQAYVRRRLDEATDGVAGYAGQAAGAGALCEKSYDALTK